MYHVLYNTGDLLKHPMPFNTLYNLLLFAASEKVTGYAVVAVTGARIRFEQGVQIQ